MAGQLDQVDSIVLDRASREPLSEQLFAALAARIETGHFPAGSRLPTTRELAAGLGISRGGVQAAYRRLAAEGLATTRVGSGTVVKGGPRAARPFDLSALVSRRASAIPAPTPPPLASPLLADFSRLTPDERFFPLEKFTATLTEAWSRRPDLWQYAPPLGLEALRVEIARRLAESGVHRSPDEILVTSGAQQGLDLVFRTFTDAGDAVAMESPTYPGALALARFSGVEIVPMPMTPEGPDVSLVRERRAKLVYVMPERQNPTGVTASEAKRREILDAAADAGALVVEDGYEEPESGITPLAARNPERVVWLGTLSKDLVPGFRIGWLAAPRDAVERLALVKRTADFQTPLPLQAAIASFLRAGADREARRARAWEVEVRREAMAAALARDLPDVSWWGGEPGSALFWLHLPKGVSGRRVAEAAAARGVAVAAGADFDPFGEDRENLRLSVSRVDREAIADGIAMLAEAVNETRARSSAIEDAPVV
ncbi:MAG TPA: PLP-dependent aminotransferase family protein [Thermoanaerobaculia bacterium]|nr:PLP-dependent aminotransferase family protein [Thermoanaerobaculia bacterium]